MTIKGNHKLTITETDKLIRAAAKPEFGAIEDATETETSVTYFFEAGQHGNVNRTTGKVTISKSRLY